MEPYVYGWYIAGAFSSLAVIISSVLIFQHLRNYTIPSLQKYIVRILILVPIYAIDTFLSLRFVKLALWWDLGRDCYQAYCIYCFFSLVVTFVAMESAPLQLHEMLELKPPIRHPAPLCWLPPIRPGRQFLLWCYRFILQYVLVKPLVSITAFVTYWYKVYGSGDLDPNKGYLWLTIVENISISLAIYFLVLFYLVTKEELKPFEPVGKFLCIKAVVFFSFWQGTVISVLLYFKVIQGMGSWSGINVGRGLQDFIICIEMFILAIVYHYVFPYRGFEDPEKMPLLYDKGTKRLLSRASLTIGPVVQNFINAASVSDVLNDTKYTFFTPLVRRGDENSGQVSGSYGMIYVDKHSTSPDLYKKRFGSI